MPSWWPYVSPDMAYNIALLAGWLALVLAITWPVGHECHDATCQRDKKDMV